MPAFTVKGVVLKETIYRETDSFLTILTAERGIISAISRGIFKLSSKNRPAAQLFCYSEFEITERGEYLTLKSAALCEQFYNVRIDPEKYALACYIVETANFFCTAGNDETDPLRLVLNALYALNMPTAYPTKPLWLVKAAYELKLCSVCGFMPELNVCSRCGRAVGDCQSTPGGEFAIRGRYTFSLAEGSLFCGKCAGNAISHQERLFFTQISRTVLLAVQFIAECPINRFTSFKISEEHEAELADFAEKYLLFVAERGFETLKYYKKLVEALAKWDFD